MDKAALRDTPTAHPRLTNDSSSPFFLSFHSSNLPRSKRTTKTKSHNQKEREKKRIHIPALPTSKKNQILPVRLHTNGTAYAGLRSNPKTVKKALAMKRDGRLRLGSMMDGCVGAV